jgi:phosphoserine phosphatase RsbU/P
MSYYNNKATAMSDSTLPTIGFLTESLNSLYQSNIWIGASDTAVKLGYTLVCFAGGSLFKSSWNEYEPQRNAIYNFLDKQKLSGIVIAGSLGNFISGSDFKNFYHQFVDIPLVCLGPEIPSVPTVIVDNIYGMRQLISHLVETHHCKKIVFVRGPEGNQEAEERLRIFQEVLVEHGITPDQDLIIKGDFSRDAGSNAVEFLLKNKFRFDALVGANDDTALGALKAFQEHHIQVPEEVLVFGFDDIEESNFSVPPLTTIRQPLYEIGCKSIEVIHDCIHGSAINGTIIVPATLITRQSCGCFRNHEISGSLFMHTEMQMTSESIWQLRNEIDKMVRKMIVNSIDLFDFSLIDELIDIFINKLQDINNGCFFTTVNRLVWKITELGGDTLGLCFILSVMRKFAYSYFGNSLPDRIDMLLQNGYVAITDSSNRIQANRRLSSERHSSILRMAGQEIASAFDLEQLIDVIAVELTNLDIDECYISLYDDHDKQERLTHLRLILALQEGKPLVVEKIQSTFNAPRIVPDGIMHKSIVCSLLVEPLFFKNEQIGIIIFNVHRCRNGSTYEILQQHISSALKGALLMKKVQEQSVALEQANIQLQKLRDSEHAYLEAIKHELELGREIQNSFLPHTIPEVTGWEIVTAFQPAREVSGDFYDIFTLPDGKLAIIICDVSGKDVSAALYMALIRTLIRALAEQALTGAAQPLDAINLTNKYLINHHFGSSGRYMYATLFMALLDPVTNLVQYINAGHNPPGIVAAGNIRQWIRTTGPAIGIIPEAEYKQMSTKVEPGEILFLYTDGITEARSPSGEFFSKTRLVSLLSTPTDSAAALVNRFNNAVKEHAAGIIPYDDITMVALRNCKGCKKPES